MKSNFANLRGKQICAHFKMIYFPKTHKIKTIYVIYEKKKKKKKKKNRFTKPINPNRNQCGKKKSN